jgi:hypothetical protein
MPGCKARSTEELTVFYFATPIVLGFLLQQGKKGDLSLSIPIMEAKQNNKIHTGKPSLSSASSPKPLYTRDQVTETQEKQNFVLHWLRL